MLKKLVTVLLMLVLILSTAYAAPLPEGSDDIPIEPQYTHISSISTSFGIDGSIASCYGDGESRYSDTITTVKFTLQRRPIGGTSWSSVCSWSDTQQGRNTAYVDRERYIVRGYDYRVYVQCTISDAEGVILETAGKYSSIVSHI